MPVSTRSQSVSSPKKGKSRPPILATPNPEDPQYVDLAVGGTPPSGLGAAIPGTAHMANLRALSRGRLKVASNQPGKLERPDASLSGFAQRRSEMQVLKTTHESVTLLTGSIISSESAQRLKARAKRNSTVEITGETELVVQSIDDSLPADGLKTPLVNHGIILNPQIVEPSSQCGNSRYRHGPRVSLGNRVPFSCPKPAIATEVTSSAMLPGYGVVQTELKASCRMRKRSFNEDLETVKEEVEQGTRIMVYVRLRPLSKKEREAGARSCVRVVNKKDVYLTEFALETDYLRLKRLKGRHFAFDAAFPENTTQLDVYNTSTAELVEAVLEGRNGSVFCYGATGAGKTHTMLGTVQNPGVMVLALKDLFSKLRQRSNEGDFMVRLSYLEVYNETVRDLLSPGRPLVLREDSKQGIVATGLTQYEAYSADEVMALLQQGNQNRTTEPTRANETSSRSHAILQVLVEYKIHQGTGSISRICKLSLIDLAGSERALATDQRTVRSLEGANINRSLLALSSCINALVEGKKHIPFRNSKLTQLLKDSLGGTCQTAMIANISPSNLSFGETQNTLHWADRAKEIRKKACSANELQIVEPENEQARLLLEVQQENQQLRLQLARLQQKLLAVQNPAISLSPMSCHATSSPYTPTKAAIQVEYRTCPPACRPPEPVHKDKDKSAELRMISELQRTVQALEEETEKIRRESALREEQLTTCIATINRDHDLQLRYKDGFIRTLCQRTLEESASTVPTDCDVGSTASRRVSGVAIPSARRQDGRATKSTATKMQSERAKRFPRPQISSKPCLPPLPDSEQRIRTGRLSRTAHVSPKTPLPRFRSPCKDLASSGRKRTFWDITNTNSPSAGTGRCTRSNTAATAPSMLLQPGFLRGHLSLN